MDQTCDDGKLRLQRTAEERAPILQRLRRIEGQVRGLQQMIEADRYCPEELQQINAVTAALREVALLITTDYLHAAVAEATKPGGTAADAAVAGMLGVLRATLRQG